MDFQRFAEHLGRHAGAHVAQSPDLALLELEHLLAQLLLFEQLLLEARLLRDALRLFQLDGGQQPVALLLQLAHGLGHGKALLHGGRFSLRGELGLQLRDERILLGGLLGGGSRFARGLVGGFRLLGRSFLEQLPAQLLLGKLHGAALLRFGSFHARLEFALELLIAHLVHDGVDFRLRERYDGAAFRAGDVGHGVLLTSRSRSHYPDETATTCSRSIS